MKFDSRYKFGFRASVTLIAVTSLCLAFAGCAAAGQAVEDSRQQAALDSGGSVLVENGRGDLWVEGWDQAQIVVEAHKVFDGYGADRDRWMRETKVLLEGDDHHRVIRVEYPSELLHSWGGWNGRRAVDLRIHLPRQINAEFKNDRGRVTVQQIAGKLDLNCDRGNMEISHVDGELRIHGDRGDVKVRDSSVQNGIRVRLDRGSARIELKHLAGDSELEVSRGDLSLTVPANTSFTLDAERSRRSSFHTDFGVLARGGLDSGRIHGDVNGGGSTIRLRGDRGSVNLYSAPE